MISAPRNSGKWAGLYKWRVYVRHVCFRLSVNTYFDENNSGNNAIGKVDCSPMKHYSKPVKISVLLCTLLGVIAAAPGFSQSPQTRPPAGPAEKTPALRVLTRLVQVSVIAQDGNGNPVMGLTKDDFTITESGQQQKIDYFTEQSNENLTLTASGKAAPPDTFSNRFEQKSNAPTSATVILLDTRNTHS